MEKPEGYPSDEQFSIKSPIFLDRNDGRLYRRTYSDMGDDHHRILQWAKRLIGNSSFDPRLLVLLEFFREFYVRRKELLKKIFPGMLQNEFIEFFRKVGKALEEVKSNQQMEVKTMQRSLSLGSPRLPRLERFKIRTVKVEGDEVQEGGQGGSGGQAGQGPAKPSGSNSK